MNANSNETAVEMEENDNKTKLGKKVNKKVAPDMKANFNRSALAEALGLLTSVVPSRTPKPILRCVQITAEENHRRGERSADVRDGPGGRH
jgi:hypothetical protein